MWAACRPMCGIRPGHCADHISYWFAADRALFCGDTLFTLGCGRVLEGSYADFWNSLQRLAALPDEARVYSGHDYTVSNARFALAADPDNEALKPRAAEAEAAQKQGRFLFPRRSARRRPRTRSCAPASRRWRNPSAWRARRRSRSSRPCANGRTASRREAASWR